MPDTVSEIFDPAAWREVPGFEADGSIDGDRVVMKQCSAGGHM